MIRTLQGHGGPPGTPVWDIHWNGLWTSCCLSSLFLVSYHLLHLVAIQSVLKTSTSTTTVASQGTVIRSEYTNPCPSHPATLPSSGISHVLQVPRYHHTLFILLPAPAALPAHCLRWTPKIKPLPYLPPPGRQPPLWPRLSLTPGRDKEILP